MLTAICSPTSRPANFSWIGKAIVLSCIIMIFTKSHTYAATNTIIIGGSISVDPVMQALANEFEKTHAGTTFIHSKSSSDEGIAKLRNGQIDIARVSRDLTFSELAISRKQNQTLQTFNIGYDAIAIITNKSVSKYIQRISQIELNKLFFEGDITNWSELTNNRLNIPIAIYTRPPSSGTHDFFNRKIHGDMKAHYVDHAIEIASTTDAIQLVQKNKNAITYIPYSAKKNANVHTLEYGLFKHQSVPSNSTTISQGQYLLSNNLIIAIDAKNYHRLQTFIKFIASNEGQKIVEANNIIPIIL